MSEPEPITASGPALADRAVAPPAPLRLAIYYGYPSLVNGARGDFSRAVAAFADYDVVVLGEGLEFGAGGPPGAAGPEEHAFTSRLIVRLGDTPRRASVYGYVDIGSTRGLSPTAVVDRIDRWAAIGARGVLLDEAGFDFGVTRARQNVAVTAAHDRGLDVCLNAFDPSDVFGQAPVPLNGFGGGNPTGLPPAVTSRDAVLLESFSTRRGSPEGPDTLGMRVGVALDGQRSIGTRIFAVATADDVSACTPFDWWSAAVSGVDAFGWGMRDYSAGTSELPWIPRPDAERLLAGARADAPLVSQEDASRGDAWSRMTTAGRIVVDHRRRLGFVESC